MTINTPTAEDKVKTPARLTLEDACALRIKVFFFCGLTAQVTRHGDTPQNASAQLLTGRCEAFAQPLLTKLFSAVITISGF